MNIHRKESKPPWLMICTAVVVFVLIAAGLIEWSARRGAAAITREILRPATPEEEVLIDQSLKDLEASLAMTEEEEADLRNSVVREVTIGMPQARLPSMGTSRQIQPLPVAPDERCIAKQRFRRLPNGWEEIGSC